ncbi:7460_t:CDS:1, partial [Gigaspora margarita]
VGEGLQNLIIKADISDMNILIESDHKLVWAEVETDAILHNSKLQRRKKSRPSRRVFLYHKAIEENWESYSKCVDALLRKKEIYNLEETAQSNETKINKEWEIISSAILKAAMKHILWINIKKTET